MCELHPVPPGALSDRLQGKSMRLQFVKRFVGILFAFVLAGLLPVVSSALAAETYVFNAALSLTGSCVTSKEDLVPDPPIADCPSGSHPPSPFERPQGVTTDTFGDIYVANFGSGSK